MIDHVSIPVRDLSESTAFYETVLAELGMTKLVVRDRTVGFGKRYPEFWLNARPGRVAVPTDDGHHVCLRASDRARVQAAYDTALRRGGGGAGAPGPRPEYSEHYYAGFFRDFDGHCIEIVTFLTSGSPDS